MPRGSKRRGSANFCVVVAETADVAVLVVLAPRLDLPLVVHRRKRIRIQARSSSAVEALCPFGKRA